MATEALMSSGTTCGQKGCRMAAALGIPNVGGNQKRLHNPCRLGGPCVGKLATQPLLFWRFPMWGGNQKGLHSACRLGNPQCGEEKMLF